MMPEMTWAFENNLDSIISTFLLQSNTYRRSDQNNFIGSPRSGAVTTPTGAIKILNAVINDRSARPFLRMVDRFGFRGVEVSGTVVNPFACSTNVEAGFPLRDLQLARVSAWGQRQRQR